MAGLFTQKRGTCLLGLVTANVEYGSAVTMVKFNPAKEEQAIKATMLTGQTDVELGPESNTIEFGYYAALAASSLSGLLYDAWKNADGEVKFAIVLDGTIAVSANNPRHVGTFVVPTAPLGGNIGSLREESQTFTVKSGTYDRLAV